jgi:putative membrane protein
MAELGILGHHMAVHILAMNLAAPALALAWRTFAPAGDHSRADWLWPVTALQLALLLGWHLPGVLPFAFASDAAMAAMHLSLFLAALAFWLAVVDAAGEAAWRPLAALAVTGKIFCLLGVLYAFAPRLIYPTLSPSHHALAPAALLADQQLAGVQMLIACPVAYGLAGLAVAARWLSGFERRRAEGVTGS